MFENLGKSAPIYVTRKTANGMTAEYSMSLGMTIVAILLIWLNVVVWGVIGLIVAFRVVY